MLIVPSGLQSCGEVEEQTSRRTFFDSKRVEKEGVHEIILFKTRGISKK